MEENYGCSARSEQGFRIVAVHGEVDLSWSSRIRDEILGALGEHGRVLVEMKDVHYIDSSGIAALVEGYQTAKQQGRRFGLLRISEPVRAVLELARLDQVFPIYDDLDAARA